MFDRLLALFMAVILLMALISAGFSVLSIREAMVNSRMEGLLVQAREIAYLAANLNVRTFETLGVAAGHLSQTSVRRTLRLGSPRFTGLPRFLNPREGICHAFGVIQKTFTTLDAEIHHLAHPLSWDTTPLSEDQEDRGCNTPYVMLNLGRILDNLAYILGMEFLHAAQAVDLRRPPRLGRGTEAAHRRFRESVPFLDTDRELSRDIREARRLVASRELLAAAREALGSPEGR